MTYELEIIEPRAKRLLEELMSLNLIRFVKKQEIDKVTPVTREERLAGLAESVAEINADMRGDIQLPTIWEALAEMEKEEENLQTSL
jgi:hypothetical protein